MPLYVVCEDLKEGLDPLSSAQPPIILQDTANVDENLRGLNEGLKMKK